MIRKIKNVGSAYAQDYRRSSIWGLGHGVQGLSDLSRIMLLSEKGQAVCMCCSSNPLPELCVIPEVLSHP